MGPMSNVLYPVGMPVFEQIIDEGRRYVDKTSLIYRMTHDYKYVFLSRPRRFGKSLLVSTLKSYFEGKRNLFKSLAIEKLDGTAQAALNQIDSKDYALAVSNTLPTTKVGINFSTETGTVTDWIISE